MRDQTDRRFAQTLARGLCVLRAFRTTDDGLGNGEIAERTGLPKPTVSRLTYTLCALGYLSHARRAERYRPGPALLALGNVASASISFVALSDAIMQRLADTVGALVLMLVRDDKKMLVVKTWRPRTVSSIWLEVGHRLPIHGTSSGHVLLASLSEELFAETVLCISEDQDVSAQRAVQIRKETSAQLMAEGFSITDPAEYFADGIHAVAKPFHTSELNEPVVFCCGAMPAELSVARMQQEVGPALRTAVHELERIMRTGSARITAR